MDTKQSSPQVTDSALRQPTDFPELPAEVLERFPEMRTWQDSVNHFWKQNVNAVDEFARAVLDVTEVAGVLVVDPNAASLYIKRGRGAGKFNDADTPFFVDRDGRFSLGTSVVWEPADNTLTVTGTIIADAGEIGGWIISATTLSKNNAVLDSAGQLALGTGNDIVILSATDGTYRLWVGNATAGTAAFSVTKTGLLFATGATISGSITATSGAIGGFNIGADYIRDVANSMGLASTVTGGDDVRFWAGNTFANRATAAFRVLESGALVATNATISGAITATTGTIGGFTLSATTLSGTNITLNSAGGASAISVGVIGAARTALGYSAGVPTLSQTNSTGVEIARLSADIGGTDGGYLNIYDSFGNLGVQLIGDSGDASFQGTVAAAVVSGALNASQLSSGTVDNARLPTTISVTNVTTAGLVTLAAGSAGAPSLTFTGATTTGLFLDTDKIASTVGGSSRFTVSATRVACLVDFKLNNSRSAGSPTPGGTVTIRGADDNVVTLITT